MIPKLLMASLESKITKIIFVLLWLLSLFWTVDRSWVNESWERIGGKVIHRTNYFELDRRPIFVVLTVILLGYLMYLFREKSQSYFGLVELIFGIFSAYLTLYKLPLSMMETWLALAGALFLTISGLRDMREAP